MRTAIVGVVTVLVGAVGGLALAQWHFGVRLAESENARTALEAEKKQLTQACYDAELEAEGAANENARLREQNKELEKGLAAGGAARRGPPRLEQTEDLGLFDFMPREGRNAAQAESDNPEESEEEQARREERRQQFREFRENARTTAAEYLAEQTAKATDPADRERLAAISEYTDAMFESFDAMRNAETDEERDAIRQTMMENGAVYRDLMQEQQASMTQDLAAKYGVAAEQQEQFLQELEGLRSNPLFRGSAMFGGRGGGPGGGGFRGGPGRGPRGPGGGQRGPGR